MQIIKLFSGVIFRNTIFSLIEMVVPAILMLVTVPYLLSGMGVDNYGIWNLALTFLGLMGVADVGIGAATTKFIAESIENQDTQSLSEIITISFVISTVLGAIFTVILYLQSSWLSSFFISSETQKGEILQIFQICVFGIFPVMLENIGLAVPRGFQEYKTTTILLFAKNIFIIIAAVWIVSRNGSVTQIVMGTVIITWASAINSLAIAFRKVKIKGAHIALSFNTFRKFTSFMLFMGMTGFGIKIFTFFDRVVVALTLGLNTSAYYSIATGVANKITAFGSAATQALLPAFSSWNVNKTKQSIWEKLVTSTAWVCMGITVPGIFVLVFSHQLVFWWLGEENGSAVLAPIRILVFIYMVKVISTPSYQAANGLGLPWLTALATTISGLATIGLIIVLGKPFGLAGAAWANIAVWVHLLLPVYMYFTLSRKNIHWSVNS